MLFPHFSEYSYACDHNFQLYLGEKMEAGIMSTSSSQKQKSYHHFLFLIEYFEPVWNLAFSCLCCFLTSDFRPFY